MTKTTMMNTSRILSTALLLLLCLCMTNRLFVSGAAPSVFQLPSKCNGEGSLLITAQASIYLKNYESKWTNNETSQSPCRVAISSSQAPSASGAKATFLVRFDLIRPVCAQNPSKISVSIVEYHTVLAQVDNICSHFAESNYLAFAVSANFFEITFTDTPTSNGTGTQSDYYLFQAINSVTITQFRNSTEDKCNQDEFQCSLPANICLNKALKCDAIVSCPDGSDEGSDCDNADPVVSLSVNSGNASAASTLETSSTSTALTTTLNATATGPDANATTNSTTTTPTNAFIITKSMKPAYERRYDIFIGLLGVLLFVTLIVVGIWLYGRRKRQWRDFLARLDNNTDWEYEQLEDGPAIAASVSRTNVIFNINDDAFDPNMHQSYNTSRGINTPSTNYNTNTTNTRGSSQVTERTPVRP